jgi:hypothetical protein
MIFDKRKTLKDKLSEINRERKLQHLPEKDLGYKQVQKKLESWSFQTKH